MITGAIFDMDGTLIDSMDTWNSVGNLFLEKRGLNSDKNLHKLFFSMTVEESAAYFKKEFNIPMTAQEIWQDISEIMQYHYENTFVLKPGVYKFLEALHQEGIKITVTTASEREMAETVFIRHGVDKFINQIFTVSEIGVSKKNPDIFYAAQRAMGSRICDTWVFEDGLYAANTAKTAGFSLCGVYDLPAADDWEALKKISDIHINTFENLTIDIF